MGETPEIHEWTVGSEAERLDRFVSERLELSRTRVQKLLAKVDRSIEIGKREIEEVPLVEGAPRYTANDLLTDGGKQSVE